MSSVCCDTLEIEGDGQRETRGRIGRDGLQGQSMMDHCKKSRSEGLRKFLISLSPTTEMEAGDTDNQDCSQ
uniref:Uncharacterized protein n=1 Tax=Coccidioides posadasii RMSCC 3488 TaxID=454284 RepID=A0A0J6I6S5_COCPO|nr:hypothetical protein CPAG_03458 [Coccidioides posadasii RMSCC 3488]